MNPGARATRPAGFFTPSFPRQVFQVNQTHRSRRFLSIMEFRSISDSSIRARWAPGAMLSRPITIETRHRKPLWGRVPMQSLGM
jgi:hypothetical protein